MEDRNISIIARKQFVRPALHVGSSHVWKTILPLPRPQPLRHSIDKHYAYWLCSQLFSSCQRGLLTLCRMQRLASPLVFEPGLLILRASFWSSRFDFVDWFPRPSASKRATNARWLKRRINKFRSRVERLETRVIFVASNSTRLLII